MWQRLKPVGHFGKEDRSSHSPQLSWVIPGKLALGGLPQSPAPLTAAKIPAILSLSHPWEGCLPANFDGQFHHYRCPLPDSRSQEELTLDQLTTAVDIIHHSLQNHQPLYVHCLAGIERSPMVCIAYLCRYDRQQLWDAWEWVKTVHPSTRLTIAQRHAIEQLLS
jgi:atypical dual specificity phosphatase